MSISTCIKATVGMLVLAGSIPAQAQLLGPVTIEVGPNWDLQESVSTVQVPLAGVARTNGTVASIIEDDGLMFFDVGCAGGAPSISNQRQWGGSLELWDVHNELISQTRTAYFNIVVPYSSFEVWRTDDTEEREHLMDDFLTFVSPDTSGVTDYMYTRQSTPKKIRMVTYLPNGQESWSEMDLAAMGLIGNISHARLNYPHVAVSTWSTGGMTRYYYVNVATGVSKLLHEQQGSVRAKVDVDDSLVVFEAGSADESLLYYWHIGNTAGTARQLFARNVMFEYLQPRLVGNRLVFVGNWRPPGVKHVLLAYKLENMAIKDSATHEFTDAVGFGGAAYQPWFDVRELSSGQRQLVYFDALDQSFNLACF